MYLISKILPDSAKVARVIMAPLLVPMLGTLFNPTLSYSPTRIVRANLGYDTEYHFFSYEDGLTFRPRIGLEIGKPYGFILNVSAYYGMFWSFERSSRNLGPGITLQIRMGGDTYSK